jgi:hypothetical protein
MGIKNKKKFTTQDKEPDIKPKGLFQLHTLRERLQKKKQVKNNKPYFAPTGNELLATLIQEQNKQLLEKIADYKELSEEDTNMLIQRFWNVSYWIPKPTKDIKKEIK